MSSILRELYESELFMEGRHSKELPEHQELRRRNMQHYLDFINKLPDDLKQEFKDVMDQHTEGHPLETTKVFIDGFCMGARMMMEVLVK